MAATPPPHDELFVCDVADVVLKDDMASMEHPFYSLSKKPDLKPRRYEYNGKWIEFRPSAKGLPTIYDKDLIIYAISHLIAGIQEGEDIPKQVEIDPYAFFQFTKRGAGGRDYQALVDSLDRIDGTRYRTNVVANGTMIDTWMGIIDQAHLETDEKTNEPRKLRITLSDMIVEAIRERTKVLTLHRDYQNCAKSPVFRAGRMSILPAQADSAACLRAGPQTLRPTGFLADLRGTAAKKKWFASFAEGVPAGDP